MGGTGQLATSPSRLGDLAERWVAMLATWKGAEVFPNFNTTGKADLLLKIEGKIYEIDVKCDVRDYSDQVREWRASNTGQVHLPVFPVAVTPDGDIANWSVRWIKNRAPAGLENFWSKDYHITSTKPTE